MTGRGNNLSRYRGGCGLVCPQKNGVKRRWGVVLATGEGRQVRRLALHVLDQERLGPRWASRAGVALIEHTVSRAARLVSPERLLTVIGSGHSVYLDPGTRLPGRILEQPASRGTGAAVMLALVYVLAEEPDATVLILPSDHSVFPDDALASQLERAACLAEHLPNRLAVLAAAPNRPQGNFGWLEAGPLLEDATGFGARSVKRFCEEPTREEAEEFLRRGYLWNTRVMVVKARTLWTIGHQLFRGMMRRFEDLLELLKLVNSGHASPDLEKLALRDVYRGLQTIDFSRRVLQDPEWIALLPVSDLAAGEWRHEAGIPEKAARSSHLRLA